MFVLCRFVNGFRSCIEDERLLLRILQRPSHGNELRYVHPQVFCWTFCGSSFACTGQIRRASVVSYWVGVYSTWVVHSSLCFFPIGVECLQDAIASALLEKLPEYLGDHSGYLFSLFVRLLPGNLIL